MHNHKTPKLLWAWSMVAASLFISSNALAQITLEELLQAKKDNPTAQKSALAFNGSDLVQAIEQTKIHSLYAYQQQLAAYIQAPRDRFELAANTNYFFNKNSDFNNHHLHGSYTWDGHKFGVVLLQGQSGRNNLSTQGRVQGDFVGVSGQYGYLLQEQFGMNLVASNLRHHLEVPRYVTILGKDYSHTTQLDFNEIRFGGNGYVHYNVDKHRITSYFGLNYSRMLLAPFVERFDNLVADYPSQQFNNLNLQMDFNYKYDGILGIEKLGVEADYGYNSPLYRWGEIDMTLNDGSQSLSQILIATQPSGVHTFSAKLNYNFTPNLKAEVGAGLIFQRRFYYTATAKVTANF